MRFTGKPCVLWVSSRCLSQRGAVTNQVLWIWIWNCWVKLFWPGYLATVVVCFWLMHACESIVLSLTFLHVKCLTSNRDPVLCLRSLIITSQFFAHITRQSAYSVCYSTWYLPEVTFRCCLTVQYLKIAYVCGPLCIEMQKVILLGGIFC